MRNILIAVIALTLAACGRIETGHVGVRTDFNKTVETTEVGVGWYGAFLTSVDSYSIKETELAMNDLKPKAKDNLSLRDLDVSIFYKVRPDAVAETTIKYSGMAAYASGTYYPAFNLVERVSRGAIYDAVASYDSLTMHTKRAELESEIRSKVAAELEHSDKGVFEVTKVIVRQLVTDPALEQSIQQAVQVQKQIEAKENEVKLARAEAERKRVEAEGTAKANAILASSLTDQFLRYEQIKMQREFAGKGTHTVLMPSNATPLIGVGK